MFSRKVFYLGVALTMTICALPAAAKAPLDDSGTPVVAIPRMPDAKAQQRLDKIFQRWESYELDLTAIEREVRRTGRLKLLAGGRQLDLELELNDLRGPGYKSFRNTASGPVAEKPSPVATFKGHVKGDPKSVVRLLIQKNFLQGYIRTEEEWLFIDPLLKYAGGNAPSKVVVFNEDDVRPEAGTLCGAGELEHRAHALDLPSEKALIAAPTWGEIDLATDADVEYYAIYGANTNTQILGVINQVDGIYHGELALDLQVVRQEFWTTEADPYSATDPNTLLNQFTDYWNANRGFVSRDLAHLFTGKDMDGSVIGIAWVGILCSTPSLSYAVSQNYTYMTKLVAHEIGHNVGANHDSGCGGDGGPIMCPSIQPNGPNTFSNASKTSITSHVNNNGSCLRRLPITYWTVLTSQTPDITQCNVGVYEAGNRFKSTQAGYITALRFYKASGETGTHVGRLWTSAGVQLANVTFTSETASGWQEQYLPYRVPIAANTYYWVTYNSNTCQSKVGCGLGSPITNGPLTADAGAFSNAGGGGLFPTNGSCSNFLADVYFTP